MKRLNTTSRIVIAISALLMISAYFTPLWRILMWAPQYPEWLGLKIWINNISGDLNTINALNHYIGMKHIRVEMFPEFHYLQYIVGFIIAAGLVTAILNRRSILLAYMSLLVLAGLGALVDFYLWGYDYGHNLDPTAAIQVPGMSYQPPLIGTKQLLNFTAFSGPDIGGWIFIGSSLIVIAVVVFEIITNRKKVDS
jgi:copper chaperone NosL